MANKITTENGTEYQLPLFIKRDGHFYKITEPKKAVAVCTVKGYQSIKESLYIIGEFINEERGFNIISFADFEEKKIDAFNFLLNAFD